MWWAEFAGDGNDDEVATRGRLGEGLSGWDARGREHHPADNSGKNTPASAREPYEGWGYGV